MATKKKTPNKKAISLLITAACGRMTYAELAENCGITRSALSKIVHEKFSRPLNQDLLQAIAANAGENADEILNLLTEANNGGDPIIPPTLVKGEHLEEECGAASTHTMVCHFVVYLLENNDGVTIQSINNSPLSIQPVSFWIPDGVYKISNGKESSRIEIKIVNRTNDSIQALNSLFPIGYLDPDCFSNTKIYLLFKDENDYHYFSEMYKNSFPAGTFLGVIMDKYSSEVRKVRPFPAERQIQEEKVNA